MMVYCRNRSMRLPRKHRALKNTASPVIKPAPYRPEQGVINSVMERRCADGKWLTKEEDWEKQEADALLDSIIYGERGA